MLVKFLTGGHDFIAKCGNGSEEIDGRCQNNSLYLTNMSPYMKSFQWQNIFWWNILLS